MLWSGCGHSNWTIIPVYPAMYDQGPRHTHSLSKPLMVTHFSPVCSTVSYCAGVLAWVREEKVSKSTLRERVCTLACKVHLNVCVCVRVYVQLGVTISLHQTCFSPILCLSRGSMTILLPCCVHNWSKKCLLLTCVCWALSAVNIEIGLELKTASFAGNLHGNYIAKPDENTSRVCALGPALSWWKQTFLGVARNIDVVIFLSPPFLFYFHFQSVYVCSGISLTLHRSILGSNIPKSVTWPI